jgi:hypothetical protein
MHHISQIQNEMYQRKKGIVHPMKPLQMLALGSVLSASLVFAQTATTPAASSTTQTPSTKTTTKSKSKKKAAATSTAAPAASTTAAPAAAPAKAAAPAASAAPAAPATTTKTAAKSTSAPKAAPTASDIADAKSKGMVWVNLNTKVYHPSGDKEYGTTKNGKFMTEADAKAAGNRAAKN